MKILIVKLSSLGDVIHTLAAITDAKNQLPDLQIDWLVDSNFSDIPNLHPGIRQVFSAPLRTLKKNIFCMATWGKIRALIHQIRKEQYDLIIDAQGLLKSAIFSRIARGKTIGFDAKSSRESAVSSCYHQKVFIPRSLHAVTRLRQLFARALQYPEPNTKPEFGIRDSLLKFGLNSHEKHVFFLHGTTWDSKRYPAAYWKQLAEYFHSKNIKIKMTYGNEFEKQFVLDFQKEIPIEIIKKNSLKEIAEIFLSAQVVVGVDTGLAHLSAALGTPTAVLYGSTHSQLTGVLGDQSISLSANFSCSPCLKRTCSYLGNSIEKPACYDSISPKVVIEAISRFE